VLGIPILAVLPFVAMLVRAEERADAALERVGPA
jgi:hypothetical protein